MADADRVIKAHHSMTQSLQYVAAEGCSSPVLVWAIHSLAAIDALPYDLVAPGGHGGKVRDADADTVPGGGPLEQKTEPDWVAARNSHEVTDDQRATPKAVARNTAGRANRSLRDIIVPTSHAGIDVEQVFAPGVPEAVEARTVPRLPARQLSGLACRLRRHSKKHQRSRLEDC
ncbi:hypothetical protein LJR234_004988 [Mesorhizobium amorphae]|jgi:hypothetical protein|uniref:hypothetical protein n=1 Tax=Mesorhizobium amorphae TaxID=71433 RepID=UPI003ECE6570